MAKGRVLNATATALADPDGSLAMGPANLSRPCPACDDPSFLLLFRATDRLYRTTAKQFQVVECKGCRLVRLEPQPDSRELAESYPDQYWYAPSSDAASRLEESWRRLVLRDHVLFVKRALRSAGETGLILDAGCGGGLFLNMIRETAGLPVLGLDYSRAAARLAWSANSVPAVCATLDHPPVAPGTCAAVTMFHVLEHLRDPEHHVLAARGLLRPEGRLIVQVPNAACWQFLLFGRNWSGVDVPRHLIDFRQSDLFNLLEHCGFEILRVKHFSLRDNPAGFATSIAPGLDPMARRVRKIPESPAARMLKDLAYLGLFCAALPFTVVEAACRAGSTIMVEARTRR